ncbi:hypothetical protein V8C35DRAFT_310885 [Trichoderma chlorosporum]
MHLKVCPTNADNMTQTMGTSDHGGSHYIELIKSNLQFIYGREYSVDVISQLKAADQWQVHVVKITSDTWSVDFSESGPVLLNVLEKLHRKSGEMLDQAFSRNPVTATVYVRSQKMEEEKAAKATSSKDEAQETKKKKKQGPEDDVVKPVAPSDEDSGLSLLSMIPDYDSADMGGSRENRRVPNRWRTRSPTREIASIENDDGVVLRSLGCTSYGPASDFHGISPYDPDAFTKLALVYEQAWVDNALGAEEDRYGPAYSFPIRYATAPRPEPAKTQAEAPAKSRVPLDKWDLYPACRPSDDSPTLRNVMLFIKWPGYGQMMVVDDCQHSVKAIQSQVRNVLLDHGADLFTEAKAVASTVFSFDGVKYFGVTVKTLTMNDHTILLGPSFGDDLSRITKGAEACRSVKIEVELTWNGADLNNAGPAPTV